MSNITTFSELRKLIKNTQWLEMKFTKDEVYNQFNLRKDQIEREMIFEQPNKEVEEYIFCKHRFNHTIDKKKQADVYSLRFLKIKEDWRSRQRGLYSGDLSKPIDSDKVKSYTIYEFLGQKGGKWDYTFNPSETLIYVDNYSDQILYVRYKRQDIWFNNFFKSKLDNSIKNNYDEMFEEREFNLLYSNTTYKIFHSKGLDYKDAKAKLEKDNPELEWVSGRKSGKWNHEFSVKEKELPTGDFDINNLRQIYRDWE